MKHLFLFLLVSCSTAAEMLDPHDGGTGYQKSRNEKGEGVYTRTRAKPINSSPLVISAVNGLTTNSHQEVPGSHNDNSQNLTPSHEDSSDINPYIEISGGDGHLHLGGGFFISSNEVAAFKLGASLFSGIKSTYLGFDAGGRIYLPAGDIRPFIGAGGYIGDHKTCDENRYQETCTKKYLTAGYLEYGVSLGSLAIFSRTYSISEAEIDLPVKYMWGVNISF